MIRPLPNSLFTDVARQLDQRPRAFPALDRAFDAVERALATLGVEDPGSLRSPQPVEDALSKTALPPGTMLILSPRELRLAEMDIEDTVRDERQGGTIFTTLPTLERIGERARALRELAATAECFGFRGPGRPAPASRLGKVKQLPLPSSMRDYKFLIADTPGFRCMVVTRALRGGGFIGLWCGDDDVINEVRGILASVASEYDFTVQPAAPSVPPLEGVEKESDVWKQADELRAYRTIREAELREIARQAALRGVQLRREREAARKRAEAKAAS